MYPSASLVSALSLEWTACWDQPFHFADQPDVRQHQILLSNQKATESTHQIG